MSADGSARRNLTRRPGQDHAPAWSPDGKRIAFASARGGGLPQIWVMNGDGSRQRRLGRVDGEYPAWSPDGKKIAFGSDRGSAGTFRLWLANAGRRRQLTGQNGERPAWSRDGAYLAFTAGGLFVVRCDGSMATDVPLAVAGEAALADWGR